MLTIIIIIINNNSYINLFNAKIFYAQHLAAVTDDFALPLNAVEKMTHKSCERD